MLLTISTTHSPATDLGFLLMKNPDNVHVKDLPFGEATLFFPEACEDRCIAAITVEVDPVNLVRGKESIEEQYVSDRPYAASSLLTVALGRLLNTAMSGRSKHRQELADTAMPLEFTGTYQKDKWGHPGVTPFALASPVLIDVDGDGHWKRGDADILLR